MLLRGARGLENIGPAAGLSSTRWEDEDSAPLDTSWLAASPSGTRSDGTDLGDAMPNAGPFGICGGEVGNASRWSCEDITGVYVMNVAEQVRNLLFSW